MALGTELFTLATQFDPYGAYRRGQMAPAAYDVEQQKLQLQKMQQAEQIKELQQEQEDTTKPMQQMAQTLVPNTWKLTDDQGMPTTAGEMNNLAVQAQQESRQGQELLRQARFMPRGSKEQINAISEARRLMNNAQNFTKQARDMGQKAQNDALFALGTAENPQDWENVVKSWTRTGMPIPQNFPTDYSPENVKRIVALAPLEVQQKINDTIRKRDEARRAEQRAIRDERRLQIMERRDAERVDGDKEFKDVKGQRISLGNYLPSTEVDKLGAKEIPKVNSTLFAADKTDELASMIEKNPLGAGLALGFFQKFEKFLPSQYDRTTETEGINKAMVDSWKPVGKHSEDEIANARLIAKKAVDVINARALAASGGSRILVAELRLQKDVLAPESLTPKSAPYVYRNLADDDRQSTRLYGIDPSKIKKTTETAKPAETPKPEAVPTRPEGIPTTAKYSPSQKKWWWQDAQGNWKSQ